MDPYLVLGVPKTATLDQIKEAYYKLVRAWHPDNFFGSPLYADAQEKVRQANLAYEQILREGPVKQEQEAAPDFAQFALSRAYSLAMKNENDAAEALLARVGARGSRWYYISGICKANRGRLSAAIGCFEAALTIEPDSVQYRAAWREAVARRKKRNTYMAAGGAAIAVVAAIAVLASL